MTWYPSAAGRHGANGAKGDLGADIVEEYLIKNNVTDFTRHEDYYNQVHLKIDFTIEGVQIDVKANVKEKRTVVECYLGKKDKPGWLYDSQATYIYAVQVDEKSIYRYNIDDMKNYVTANKQRAVRMKNGDVLMWVSVNLDFIEKLQ